MTDKPVPAPQEAFVEAVPPPPSADPWTIAAYVGLTEALNYLEGAAFSKWQQAVAPQLAEIAAKLAMMAEQINGLIPRVEQALLANTMREYKTEIESHRASLEDMARRYTPGQRLSDADRGLVLNHKYGVELRLGQLLQHNEFGFAGYAGVVSGLATMSLVYGMAALDRGELNTYMGSRILPYFDAALDRTLSYSFTSALANAMTHADAVQDSVNAITNKRWLLSLTALPQSGQFGQLQYFGWWRICRYLENTDHSVAVQTEDTELRPYDPNVAGMRPEDPWMPGLPEHYDWGDRDKGRERGMSIVRDAIAAAQAALNPVRIISARRDDVIKCRDALRARLGH